MMTFKTLKEMEQKIGAIDSLELLKDDITLAEATPIVLKYIGGSIVGGSSELAYLSQTGPEKLKVVYTSSGYKVYITEVKFRRG